MTPSVMYRGVGLAGSLVAAALVAQQLKTLLLAVVLTIILSLPLSAAGGLAERRGVPRAVGALGALIAILGAATGAGFALIPTFVSQAQQFAGRLPVIVAEADRYLHGLGANRGNISGQLSNFVQGYVDHPIRLIAPLEHIGLTVLGVTILLVMIILAAFLIALKPAVLIENGLRLLPPSRHDQACDVLVRIRTAWLGWMTAVGIDMLVLGGLLFAGMKLIGLSFAFGFAAFSACMTVIPNYGSVISALPPLLQALAQSPSKALLVLAVYLVVNQIEGNLILPLIMSRTVEMHPAVVAVGLLVMGALFGVVGVLIAIPLLSLVIILVQALWVEPQEALGALPDGDSAPGAVRATSS